MMKHLDAELVAQVDKPFMVWRVKLPIGFQADQRPGLTSEIIGHLGDMNQTLASLEHAAVMLVEEVGNSAQQVMRKLWFNQGINQGLLKPSQ